MQSLSAYTKTARMLCKDLKMVDTKQARANLEYGKQEIACLEALAKKQVIVTTDGSLFQGCSFVERGTFTVALECHSLPGQDSPIMFTDIDRDLYRSVGQAVFTHGFDVDWKRTHTPGTDEFNRKGHFGTGVSIVKLMFIIAK
jgi:hypothetical protein